MTLNLDKETETELKLQRESASACILSSTFSPDNNYFIAGSKGGRINVWRLSSKLSSKSEPALSFVAHNGPINCLEFASATVLMSGGDEEARAWDWSKLVAHIEDAAKKAFDASANARVSHAMELQAPQTKGPRGSLLPRAETNAIAAESSSAIIYAACGDSNAYAWDLSSGKCVSTFSGHTDAVYTVAPISHQRICTGSEDGTVRVWDVRSSRCLRVLDPSSGATLASASLSDEKSDKPSSSSAGSTTASSNLPVAPSNKRSWVSCMAADDAGNYLVVGGGSRCLSLWHLQTMTVAAVMPTPGTPQHVVVDAANDRILSVGNEPYVYHWKMNGKLTARVKASSTSLFSVASSRSTTNPIIIASGNSAQSDVYLNPVVLAFQLNFKSN